MEERYGAAGCVASLYIISNIFKYNYHTSNVASEWYTGLELKRTLHWPLRLFLHVSG